MYNLARQKRFSIILLFAVFLLASSVFGQQQDQQMVKGQAYLSTSALKPGSDFKLAVVLDIAKGFHINGISSVDGPAKLDIRTPSEVKFDPPQFPKETLISFNFAPDEKLPVYEGKITVFVDGHVAKDAKPGKRDITAVFSYQGCSETQCYPPAKVVFTIPTKIAAPGESVTVTHQDIFGMTSAESNSGTMNSVFGKGMLLGLLAIFGLGLATCLTPCVYPMIPVTVGFFGMQTERKTGRLMILAALYVIGLAITYSTMGIIAAKTGGMFGAALQSPYVPLFIAVVLVALALSMFGVYEFRIPSSIAARTQGKNGPLGALLMGLLFGFVAAPCVGPVTVGLLVYVGKIGNPFLGFMTFFMLAMGMGVPFFFLAIFSGSLNKLPRAGMWMVSVRKVFGFLMLGAAVYYLTPLIGSHISEKAAELALPLFILAAGIYIGIFERINDAGGCVKAARHATWFGAIVAAAVMVWPIVVQADSVKFLPYSDEAIKQAVSESKPVMIDFTAEWCTACKELEHKTFPNPQVIKESKRFVRLQADVSSDKSPEVRTLKEKYNVQGPPTIVFLDSKGDEVENARIIGFVKPDKLIDAMRTVK